MTVENQQENKEDNKNNMDEVLAQLKTLGDKVGALESENKTLKEFADKTIQEKRDMKAKTDQAIADKEKELLDKQNRTKDENELLFKQYKEKAEALELQVKDFRDREYQSKVGHKALELAQKLAAKNPEKAALLAEKIQQRIKIDEDGTVKVLDDKGQVTISQVDALVNEFSTKYAFLCDGVESTGGGSHSSASAQVTKKLSEMSEAEKVELYNTDKAKYMELRQQ